MDQGTRDVCMQSCHNRHFAIIFLHKLIILKCGTAVCLLNKIVYLLKNKVFYYLKLTRHISSKIMGENWKHCKKWVQHPSQAIHRGWRGRKSYRDEINRVTRLGEFSALGRLWPLFYCKRSLNFDLLLAEIKKKWRELVWAIFWGDCLFHKNHQVALKINHNSPLKAHFTANMISFALQNLATRHKLQTYIRRLVFKWALCTYLENVTYFNFHNGCS
jgi:hypothetical protein